MIQFHFGALQHAGTLRFDTGRSYFTRNGERVVTTHYVVNPIRRLYGVSWTGESRWLFGFTTLDRSTMERPQTIEPASPSRTGDAS